MTSYPDLDYRTDGPVAYLTLNRPELKNAFTLPMLDSLCRALEAATGDDDIKVIVLRGAGGSFSSGGNVKDMDAGRLASWDMKTYLWDHVQRVPQTMARVDKPVIAAIAGPAFGGGFDLALGCDFRIAAGSATFCSTFVRIGLAPGNGGAWFLPRLVGPGRALDILLTGRVMAMDEARELGLVDRVVPADQLDDAVRGYALEIARWPLPAIRAIKRAVQNGGRQDLRGHLDYVSSQLALLSETPEHREAVRRLVAGDE